MQQEPSLFKAVCVSAICGLIVWTATFGFMHAFVVSVDWVALAGGRIWAVFNGGAFLWLVIFGVLIGGLSQLGAVIGAMKSPSSAFTLPLLIGIALGVLQGVAVGMDFWGFAPLGIPLRSATTRLIVGGLFGLLVVPIILSASVMLRGITRTARRRRAQF